MKSVTMREPAIVAAMLAGGAVGTWILGLLVVDGARAGSAAILPTPEYAVPGVLAVGLLAIVGYAAWRRRPGERRGDEEEAEMETGTSNGPPIACDLGVFDADERSRHTASTESLFADARAMVGTATGYAFRLAADSETLQRAADFIAHERRCCPFFRFDLTVRPGEDAAWLEVGGSAEVREFMRAQVLPRLREVGLVPDRPAGEGVAAGGLDGRGC